MVGSKPERRNVSRQLDQWVKKLKCSGTGGGLALESFKDIRVGLNTCPVDLGRQQSLDPIDSEELKDLVGDDRTSTSLITVRLSEDIQVKASFKAGLRHGQCEVTFAQGDIRSIKGEYRAGRLSGRARVVFSPGNSLDGFFSSGLLHGFARHFDEKGRLVFAGNHSSGVAVGTCWNIIRGGGAVVGQVDDQGLLTGDNIAYIYPGSQRIYSSHFNYILCNFNKNLLKREMSVSITTIFEEYPASS